MSLMPKFGVPTATPVLYGSPYQPQQQLPPFGAIALPPEQVQTILNNELAGVVAAGGRVAWVSGNQAIVVFGHPVNHVLHAILTIFLLGLWLIPWIAMAATGGEKRMRITVDPYTGKVTTQKA